MHVAVNLTSENASFNNTMRDKMSLLSPCNEQSGISLFQSKEEFVFVFGGFNSNGFLSSVEVLDVKRGVCRNFPQAIKGRTQGAAITLPGKDSPVIWLLGGRDQISTETDSV
jgi:hypothetical protein